MTHPRHSPRYHIPDNPIYDTNFDFEPLPQPLPNISNNSYIFSPISKITQNTPRKTLLRTPGRTMTNAHVKCPKMLEGHLTCTTLQYYIDYIDKDLLEPRFLHFSPQRYPRGCPWTLLLVWGPMFGTQNSLFISTTHVRNTSRPPPQNTWELWKVNLIMCI